jgi:hypothetical protein
VKSKGIAILIFAASVLAAASAQDDEIGGAGTPNFIARFSATHRLSNSTIFQSPNEDVGIGTTTPVFPLHVFSDNTFPPAGQDFPVAAFVEISAALNSVCADCAIIGIEGVAS